MSVLSDLACFLLSSFDPMYGTSTMYDIRSPDTNHATLTTADESESRNIQVAVTKVGNSAMKEAIDITSDGRRSICMAGPLKCSSPGPRPKYLARNEITNAGASHRM
jgi:hypothetical protein